MFVKVYRFVLKENISGLRHSVFRGYLFKFDNGYEPAVDFKDFVESVGFYSVDSYSVVNFFEFTSEDEARVFLDGFNYRETLV